MDIYPAIDLRDGRCVRLVQGDYDRETVYRDDPVEQARDFAAAGARWIHVVDLDAARTGEPVNRSVIAAMVAAVDVPIQVGGGVRDQIAAETLIASGVRRIVLGTAALEQPALVHRLARSFPVAVGLDARDGELAVRGWKRGSGRNVIELVREFEDAGVEAFVVTEIGRDGTLQGPDLEGLGKMLETTEVPVVASGGVGFVTDLVALADLRRNDRRLTGVIVGRALYEGRFDLPQALAAVTST
jgi:phosphoribosylformimino-5-aminoimidazole carboxamide ribotide isomerase